MRWDPLQYGRYSVERSRPFFDLVGQIGATAPTRVVDLGCGPGELTASLIDRWPDAHLLGLDSSAEMIEQAQTIKSVPVEFRLATAETFQATNVDVLLSNAMLQWIPDHLALLSRWAEELNPSGWLAFQVPANFSSPSHQLMRELANSSRWRATLGDTLRHDDAVAEPDEYLALLSDGGLRVTAWQTSYLHVLQGEDPVLQWVRGTGLRPVLAALSPTDSVEFESECAARLRQAYPPQPFGTVFPFLRTFVVAHKPA
jgi:trans-aconitate 2-methyltransferase